MSNALTVQCGGCKHVWKAATLPLPLQRMAAILKGLHCPECGADSKTIFVGAQEHERPATTN